MRLLKCFLIFLFFAQSLPAQIVKTGDESNLIDLFGRDKIQRQRSDLNVGPGKRAELPFEYRNNFIIVELVFNDLFPLKFIFDTGAEHTVLTKRQVVDILGLNYQRRFEIMGADLETTLIAYLVRGVSFKTEELLAYNRSILVLEQDYFKFDEFIGTEIHGILGADFFRRFVIEIDYDRKRIVFMDPAKFKPPKKGYEQLKTEIFRSKPYIEGETLLPNKTRVPTKLLMDTGASLGLLLYTDTHPDLNVPENNIPSDIGFGLSGVLKGYLGRVDRLEVEDLTFNGVVTNFQKTQPTVDSTYLNNRNGIIGNELLSRFDIILDYPRQTLYLKPDKDYGDRFKFDMSGIFFIATGKTLSDFKVLYVLKDSPAERAGVQKGDMLVRLNGWPSGLLTLNGINNRLRKKEGKLINLVLDRGEERIKLEFELEQLL